MRSVQRVFRMAYAATVTLQCDGEGPSHPAIWPMPQGTSMACAQRFDDVLALLSRCPSLLVVLLCDGAKELWNRLGAEFDESSMGRPVHRLVDLWHLLEKLGSAAKVLYGDEEARAARQVAAESAQRRQRGWTDSQDACGQSKSPVRIGDSRPRMKPSPTLRITARTCGYATARRLGLPVGSGNVEATKSLFEVRSSAPAAAGKRTPAATSSTCAPSR